MIKLFLNWIVNNFNLLLTSILALLLPIQPLLLTVGFLIATDFLIGIIRALYTKQKISSRKMGHSISKIILYTLAVIAVYFFELNILKSGLPLANITATLIGLVELKSIDESINTITGFSFFEKLRKTVLRGQSETKDFMNNTLDKD